MKPPVTPPLYHAIYAVVRRIPRGRVATYGQIAALIGKPRAARAVGRALRELPDALVDRVPWQRVINAAGRCSERGGFGAERQRDRLEAEGVRVDVHGKVSLRQVAWKGLSAAHSEQLRRAVRTQKPAEVARSSWVASPGPQRRQVKNPAKRKKIFR